MLDRLAAAAPDDLATIIYTSGTTGRPKGCELSHRNFVDLTNNTNAIFGDLLHDEASTLLFLPLAHVFARFIEVLCVGTRVTMGHTADIKVLVEDLGEFKPTFILSVPRVFEKVYNSAEQRAESDGKGRIFRIAADTAVAWSQASDRRGPGPLLRVKHAVFDRLVYGKLRAALGGQVEYAVSGGAPLGERLGHFYRGIGLVVLEGYGLTETTAPSTVNRPAGLRIGTVGQPLPGVSLRIADDGEILVKGYHVFTAYWNNEAATQEAKPDGWFHTGDVGELDDAGYLRITGRKKEILVTAGGKNVAPAVLEDRLRAHPLVSQCIVVGDQKPFIAAAGHPGRRDAADLAGQQRQARDGRRDRREGPRRAGGHPGRRRRREPGGQPGRGDQEVRHPGGRLHRGQRLPDARRSSSSATWCSRTTPTGSSRCTREGAGGPRGVRLAARLAGGRGGHHLERRPVRAADRRGAHRWPPCCSRWRRCATPGSGWTGAGRCPCCSSGSRSSWRRCPASRTRARPRTAGCCTSWR